MVFIFARDMERIFSRHSVEVQNDDASVLLGVMTCSAHEYDVTLSLVCGIGAVSVSVVIKVSHAILNSAFQRKIRGFRRVERRSFGIVSILAIDFRRTGNGI